MARELEDLYREALEIIRAEAKAHRLTDTRYINAVIERVLDDEEDPNDVCVTCCGIKGRGIDCPDCREFVRNEAGCRAYHEQAEG